jgi:hypothetical protein
VSERPFWRQKRLDEMSGEEWEALCDGCAKCCLNKLEDIDTGEIAYTEVACRLLDLESCRCTNYAERRRLVADCVSLEPGLVENLGWLPSTCAYRLMSEGRPLPDWHPLVAGDGESVHRAGISVRGRVVSERDAGAFEEHVVIWPE